MSLKLYYFPWKHSISGKISSRDEAILATSKKVAIASMGDNIEDFYKSKIRVIGHTIVALDATVRDFDKKIFIDCDIKLKKYHEFIYDMSITDSPDINTQSELLKLFKERLNEYELYSEGW